jgi:hypothetical protein
MFNMSDAIKKLQAAMNAAGADPKLSEDGDFGALTQAASEGFDFTVTAKRKPQSVSAPMPGAPAWYKEAKKYNGKLETDPAFNKQMSAKWSLLGLNLGTIAANWAAWCGLAVTVALAGAGYSWQKNGAAAKNWDSYGVAIDWRVNGIPRGAIVRINHLGNCSSGSNNHVTMSDGDCSSEDLKGGTFNGYGGNQGNAWKVSQFPVAHICAVRWPKEAEPPPKITKSQGCKGQSSSGESTR